MGLFRSDISAFRSDLCTIYNSVFWLMRPGNFFDRVFTSLAVRGGEAGISCAVALAAKTPSFIIGEKMVYLDGIFETKGRRKWQN